MQPFPSASADVRAADDVIAFEGLASATLRRGVAGCERAHGSVEAQGDALRHALVGARILPV